MSFLEHLVSQEKSGSITKKDALDMKMNYLSLNQKERDELDGQYSIKKTETSATKKNSIVEPEKKTTKEEVVSKEVNKENAFSEKLLVNFMKGISPNNYELIFDSYYVFLKNKFGQNKEVDDIIEQAAKKQLRDGEAEKFYNEYINRKVKENSNYDKQIDSEIRQKVLHPKKKTKKVSNVNPSGLPKLESFLTSVYKWVVIGSILFGGAVWMFTEESGTNKTKDEVKKSVKKYKSCKQCSKDIIPGQGFYGTHAFFGQSSESWCSKSCHNIWFRYNN